MAKGIWRDGEIESKSAAKTIGARCLDAEAHHEFSDYFARLIHRTMPKHADRSNNTSVKFSRTTISGMMPSRLQTSEQ